MPAHRVLCVEDDEDTRDMLNHKLRLGVSDFEVIVAPDTGTARRLMERERFFHGDGYVPVFGEAGIDLVVLAGFLWKVPQTLLDAYPRKIINIHPALLPRYGGKGMYGAHVHEAVRASGDLETGITIHYVDDQYDHGDVIFQARCAVAANDNAQAIAKSVQQLEHYHYPRVIAEVLEGITAGGETTRS